MSLQSVCELYSRSVAHFQDQRVFLLHRSPGTGLTRYFSLLDIMFIIIILYFLQLFLDDTKVKNFITCFKGDCYH